MTASSLLNEAAFASDRSTFVLHQLVLLLGSAMTALNACVEAKSTVEQWEATAHHCLASLGFVAGYVHFMKDESILEDFCRYVMSVLPCVLEANLEDELLVNDTVMLMEKMSRFMDAVKRSELVQAAKEVVAEKTVIVSSALESRCEEEESDSSSYTYESYYSYETVSEEEVPTSMPTLVSGPEAKEEDWGFEEESGEDIVIDDGVLMASNILISSENHSIDPENEKYYMDQPLNCKAVHVGEGTWIGEKVCIMPGVGIGKKCVIGAASIVTKSIPDYSMAVGSPAKVIKKYDFKTQRWEKLEE